ncbi:hypothetical protein AB0O75_05440 [Streptomyces sp. NPDC088921]|uniref:hypothetical protein n=1 Tax=unclassified Streptomyces TaxID=2593676 RepID=UPI00343D5FA8
MPVALRHGVAGRAASSAVLRVLTGADEAALDTGGLPGGELWVTRVLATAVRELGGRRPSLDDLRALCVGDRNALLLTVIAVTYGGRAQWVVDCPGCGDQLDAEVDLAELAVSSAPAATRHNGTRRRLSTGTRFRLRSGSRSRATSGFRLPTGADLEAASVLDDVTEARMLLLDRCVDAWHELDDTSLAAVEGAMAEADPLADIELLLTCASCEAPVSAGLDAAAELAAHLATGRQLMADVHAIALAYGWTEHDVLALPRPRRTAYLSLIADGEL